MNVFSYLTFKWILNVFLDTGGGGRGIRSLQHSTVFNWLAQSHLFLASGHVTKSHAPFSSVLVSTDS